MKPHQSEKGSKRGPFWYNALLFLLIAVFLGSAGYLAHYYINSRQQSQAFDDLAALVDSARVPGSESHGNAAPEPTVPTDGREDPPSDTPATEAPIIDLERNEEGILLEYASLHEMNPDMAGWLSIEDTRINYPVMHTPDRTDYYLRRDFNGKKSTWGCIYAKEECSLDAPSDNITIYGHNMKDGSMFAALHSYTSRDFWEAHRYIRFDTLTEHHTYEIFAVFKTTASKNKGFAYHDFINAPTQEHFDSFVSKCLSLALYDTELVPAYGDKLICLSTCDYGRTNGRLVVAAMRIE